MLYFRLDMRLTDRAVLAAIYNHREPRNQQAIAEHIGCSDRTIRRSLKRLKALGYVEVKSGGSRYPNRYQIQVERLPHDIRRELEHS